MPDSELMLQRLRQHIASKNLLLPAQEEAVFSDAALTLVGAGAGTGKTHTLSWRFLRALLREETLRGTGHSEEASPAAPEIRLVRPRDILTLTFTDKAANEMRERISSLFEEIRPILDPDRTLLNSVTAELQEAQISTIHAFALNIVREEALFLPSGLGARPVAPPEAELFTLRSEKALDTLDFEWFTRNLPPGRTSDDFLDGRQDDLADVVTAYSSEQVVSFALSLSDLLENRGESPGSLLKIADNPDYFEAVKKRILKICLPSCRNFAHAWAEVFRQLPETLPGKGNVNERIEGLRRLQPAELLSRDDPEELFSFAGRIFRDILGNLKGVSGSKTGALMQDVLECSLKEHRERFAALQAGLGFLSQEPPEFDVRLRAVLLRTAALIWESYREFRRRRGLLSYDDMIRLAAEIAAPGGSARPVRTYHEILVDEYQDTNPLQDRLINSVAAEGSRRFLVGDPKQSIYRFRHADPTLFQVNSPARRRRGREGPLGGGSRIASPPEDTDYIPLQTSFRTRPALLKEINRLFGRIWRNGIASTLPAPYEELLFPEDAEAERLREETSAPPLVSIILRQGYGEPIDKTRRRVADALGKCLVELHGQPVWDKKEKTMRPAQWRDMTILVPSRSSFPPLEEVLYPEYGIPAAFEKGKQYFDRGEIGDMITAIRTLAFPDDRAALLGFLASPFSGLNMSQFSLFLSPDAPPLESLFPDTAALLEELRSVARYSGLFAALVMLLKNQSFLLAYPHWNRKSVLANLWKGLDLLREYEAVFGNDPGGCAAYVARMAGRKGAGEESTPLGEEEDVVRVLTVHSAKGLEFPITVVMDLNNKPGGGGNRTSLIPSVLLGVGASRHPDAWNDGSSSQTGKIARFLEETETREEWQRLFYVAATRAMDCLVLCSPCTVKDGLPVPRPGSWLDLLQIDIPEDEEAGGSSPSPAPTEKAERKTGLQVPPPPTEERSLERMSATSYSLFRYCPAAWRMKFRQGLELAWELPSSEEAGGSDLGSLAHWVLSRWNFRADTLSPLLGEEPHSRMPQGLRAVWREKHGRSELRRWLERFSALPAGQAMARLHDEGALRREIPFRIRMKEEGCTLPLALIGSVDVLWVDGDTVYIRDYKITAGGNGEEPAWKTLYREQLLFYGYAASLAFPGKKQDIRLVHLREGIEGEKIELPASWNKIGESIRAAAAACATGPFPAAAERCPACFYRLDCPYRE